jgi:hypothetical protein
MMTDHRLTELAARITGALRAAGLPPLDHAAMERGGFGVREHEDASTPMVTVSWQVSHELTDAALEVMATDPRHPLIYQLGLVGSAMSTAILEILRSAGFDAAMSADDLQPGVIEVIDTSRQEGR